MTNLDLYLTQYFEEGGTVTKVPERAVTVDWSKDAPTLRVARAMSRLGHARRYRGYFGKAPVP